MLAANFGGILFAYRFFGKTGLLIWIPIAAIIANIQVVKTVELFGITATLGNIVYATSFLATDILNENYGKKEAGKAVYIGFFSLILLTIMMNLALLFKPDSSDFAQESLSTIFSIMPRITLGSLIAYGVSQLHDVWAYNFWKQRNPEKKFLWIRNNLSTMVSQLIDSAVFTVIAFLGLFPTEVFIEILITTYIFKLIVAALDTPFLYIAKGWKDKGIIK
ncbi:MAG: queuosine precursor transporter [Spirochaetales bacterium]|nr:queuosine precursor transporter [Spirochaetales bacterium]